MAALAGAARARAGSIPPTLFTEVAPAATIAQVEIFGPVVVLMTFRTPVEAVELANNTRYGLAASVWTENINLALDVAPQLKAGTVWINCTNVFDAASGFGGYRESGFGREGGREGLREYVRWAEGRTGDRGARARAREARGAARARQGAAQRSRDEVRDAAPSPHRPHPQALHRRRAGAARFGLQPAGAGCGGRQVGEVGQGNRKDMRNAVEAARKAERVGPGDGARARPGAVLPGREPGGPGEEFGRRIVALTGDAPGAEREVALAIERIYTYAALADKYDGLVHHTPYRNVTLAMPEPMGVLGLVCPESPSLLGFVSLVLPAIAMGNTVVAVPSTPRRCSPRTSTRCWTPRTCRREW